jgi:hypothetical protein
VGHPVPIFRHVLGDHDSWMMSSFDVITWCQQGLI